jgi:5-hydroxyisourate hydrolase
MGISTHILDTNLGQPAANVPIILSEFRDNAAGGSWHEIGATYSGFDGRCNTLLTGHCLVVTDYKLLFNVGVYFKDLGLPSLYPYVEIVIRVADPSQHYHVPLLLSANSYTTYRGS